MDIKNLENKIKEFIDYERERYVGMVNDRKTRLMASERICYSLKKLFEPSGHVLINHVVCDETNNPIDVVRANDLVVTINGQLRFHGYFTMNINLFKK